MFKSFNGFDRGLYITQNTLCTSRRWLKHTNGQNIDTINYNLHVFGWLTQCSFPWQFHLLWLQKRLIPLHIDRCYRTTSAFCSSRCIAVVRLGQSRNSFAQIMSQDKVVKWHFAFIIWMPWLLRKARHGAKAKSSISHPILFTFENNTYSPKSVQSRKSSAWCAKRCVNIVNVT